MDSRYKQCSVQVGADLCVCPKTGVCNKRYNRLLAPSLGPSHKGREDGQETVRIKKVQGVKRKNIHSFSLIINDSQTGFRCLNSYHISLFARIRL